MTQVGDAVDPDSLVGQRWFAAPARGIGAARVEERFSLAGGGGLAILNVASAVREATRYTVPLEPLTATWRGLATVASTGGRVQGEAGWSLEGLPPRMARAMAEAAPHPSGQVRALGADQSNTSWVVGDSLVKLYRRIAGGRNPEAELSAALAADAGAPVPEFRGAVRMRPPGAAGLRGSMDIAIVQRFVPDASDEFERVAEALAAWLRAGAPRSGRDELVASCASIGEAVAGLHGSLAALRGPGLTPRAATTLDRDRWQRAASRTLDVALFSIRRLVPALAPEIVAARPRLVAALRPLSEVGDARLTRIHGDLHLGQVIRDGDAVLLTDLEGEPTRTAAARRRPDLPLRDVASMLRSIDHVTRSGARRAGTTGPGDAIDRWIDAAREAFLAGHGGAVDEPLLHALEVEKELYEFTYAARFLPAWAYAPTGGLRWLLETRAP